METSALEIKVECDSDNECSVVATLTSAAFRGRGHAWLDVAEIAEFAARVGRLAATSVGRATLQGGYFDRDGAPDYTINLTLESHGHRGYIRIAGDLATDPPTHGVLFVHRTSATIVVEPAALERFARELAKVAPGKSVIAIVEGQSAV